MSGSGFMWSVRPWINTTVDSVHESVDIFHDFSNSKINLKIWKFTESQVFYKNHLELFQNYVLVPIILHIGPYLTFYIYN
jgi:hypothetical protein